MAPRTSQPPGPVSIGIADDRHCAGNEQLAQVAVMRGGTIVEQGSASQIVEAPRESYTRALMAAMPRSLSAELSR
jgi:ABC-type dipeptide/oligopeptide/nickel transport system ATPase component